MGFSIINTICFMETPILGAGKPQMTILRSQLFDDVGEFLKAVLVLATIQSIGETAVVDVGRTSDVVRPCISFV